MTTLQTKPIEPAAAPETKPLSQEDLKSNLDEIDARIVKNKEKRDFFAAELETLMALRKTALDAYVDKLTGRKRRGPRKPSAEASKP